MTIFTDTFDRANGALGGNWVASSANVGIAGNWASCSSVTYWWAYNTTLAGSSTRVRATTTVNARYGAASYHGPAVKINTGSNTGYYAVVSWAAGVYSLRIGKGALTASAAFAAVNLPYAPPGVFNISIEWNNGHLTATIPGLATVEADDADYAAYNGLGMRGLYTTDIIASIVLEDGAEPALAVTPSPIGNYGAAVALAFAGTETTWDTTEPVFTVGDGTLTNIAITSDTAATGTYDPGTFLGTTTFTDPSTGATDDVLVTSDPRVVPPADSCRFTPEAVAMLNNTAGDSLLEVLMKPNTEVSTSAWADLSFETIFGKVALNTGATLTPDDLPTDPLLPVLWQLINGSHEPEAGPWLRTHGVPLVEEIADIKEALAALITANDYTLGSVITTLAGEGVKTHLDILDAIALIDPGGETDLSPVLDAIAALRGDEIATVAMLVEILGQIRTVNTWHLGDVKGWIDAVQGTNSPTIHDVRDDIAALNDAPPTDLSGVLADIAANKTVTDAVLDALLAYLVPEAATVQTILDAIDGIQAGEGGAVPPIWQGTANETLGEPVALVDQLVVDGPMDGVLIDVTTPPQRLGQYHVGGEILDYGVGRITFGQEDGYLEMWQYLSFRKAIYTPRTMTQATTAHLQVLGGAGGTVTTFIRS